MFLLGRTQMIVAATYEDAVKRLMAKGFDGVEIDLYDRSFTPRPEFYEEGFAEAMRAIMTRYGVKAFSVGAHMDYTESDEKFMAVKNAIPVAKALGSPLIIINGALKNDKEPFNIQWDRQIEKTKALCAAAEEFGMLLAMEFEPGFVFDTTARMLQAFDEIGSDRLRVNADIGHMFLQDPDPLLAIEQCGKYIVHAHLENMKAGVHNHLVPYEGDMDLPAYLAKLREVGFDGPASFDAYQYDYEAVAEASIRYFRSLL